MMNAITDLLGIDIDALIATTILIIILASVILANKSKFKTITEEDVLTTVSFGLRTGDEKEYFLMRLYNDTLNELRARFYKDQINERQFREVMKRVLGTEKAFELDELFQKLREYNQKRNEAMPAPK